jgi:hypothetical protein
VCKTNRRGGRKGEGVGEGEGGGEGEGRGRGRKAREEAREKEREKKRRKVKMKKGKVKKVKKKRAMTHRVAMIFGASQPTLALGRQTSNCHVGQDWCRRLTSGSSWLLSSRKAAL